MAKNTGKNKAAASNKKNNTALNAGAKKLNNTTDGNKSVPGVKKWSSAKTMVQTFTSNKKMKKPTK
jgi:hypothetical protein